MIWKTFGPTCIHCKEPMDPRDDGRGWCVSHTAEENNHKIETLEQLLNRINEDGWTVFQILFTPGQVWTTQCSASEMNTPNGSHHSPTNTHWSPEEFIVVASRQKEDGKDG